MQAHPFRVAGDTGTGTAADAAAGRRPLIAGSGAGTTIGIAGALTLSAVIHATLLSAGGFSTQASGSHAGASLQVRLASLAPPVAPPAQAEPREESPRSTGGRAVPASRNRQSAPGDALPASRGQDEGGAIERAPRAQTPITLATFDPTRYLTSRQVDRFILPADPDWLDRIPFSGTGPGEWLARLFINEEGVVDEVEILENRGSQVNTDELRAYLATARFEPARRGAEAVKSQTMLEIRFQSTTSGPDLFRPSPVPSAKGR